ncbi:MAG: Ig-like domain-containing protein [Acidobacteriota bacterium]
MRRPSLAALASLLLASVAIAGGLPPVTPGFPNVPQTPGELLSGLNAPEQGRTAIIAYHDGVLFTIPEVPSSGPDSDYQVRTWDLANPRDPVELATWGVTPHPVNAHGYFKSGEYLVLGANWPPEAPWSFRSPGSSTIERTTFPGLIGAGVRGILFTPWYVGDTWWVYNEIEGNAFIELRGERLAEWDHLGMTGVIGHPFLLGDLLIFASDQSRTGVATYDVSDPRNPVLLDVLTTGGAGGYWPEIWGSGDGRLYVVFPYRTGGNGLRVVDATDPADLQFVGDLPLPGAEAMYLQFQDHRAFVGDHVVDMRSLESILFLDGANVTRTNDGGVGVDTSQFALPLGNLVITGGITPNQGMAVWAHQADPDTTGPMVGYHVPQEGRTNYPVGAPISLLIHETLETFTIVNGESFLVRPLGGDPVEGSLIFSFDDVLTFQPDEPLLPDTTYEVVLPEGGIKDAAGNGMVGHSFTFSTGGAVAGNAPPEVVSLRASAYPARPAESVTLLATATDPEGESLEYRFDPGDGTDRSPWSGADVLDHVYAEPGHYEATVQVRDPAGAIASGKVTVTVVAPLPLPQPTRSSPIACDPAGRRVAVVNPDNDSLTVLDADTLGVLAEEPTCDDPRSLVLVGDETWVACRHGDALAVHGVGGALEQVLPLPYGDAPVGLAVSPDGTTLHVAMQGPGELVSFDVATRTETGRVPLGPRARAVAVTGDGTRVLTTRFLAAEHHGEVWEVDPTAGVLARTHRLNKFGGDANRDTTASGKGVANQLGGVAISPDGRRAWVVGNKPNSERGPLFRDDLDQDNTVRSVMVQLDLETGGVASAIDLDNSDVASAVGYSPLGDYLFVALQGNDEVVVLDALRVDASSGLGSLVTRIQVGGAPMGVCFDPVTNRTFVKNFTGRSVTVLETDALFRIGDKTVASATVSTVTSETLAPDVLLGKRIFHHASDPRMSSEGYISCASCHPDGGHDGRTWDFTGRGEGLRNTVDLRGRGGMEHGNVHWSANFDEIQDFEADIRGAFGGSGFLSDEDWESTRDPLGAPKEGLSPELDALAAYLTSLDLESVPKSPHRNPDGTLTADAIAGRDASFDVRTCGSCHARPRFTDSTRGLPTLSLVGSHIRTTSGLRLGEELTGIDVPTLHGLWDGAPFIHDGSAATVQESLELAGGTVYPAEGGVVADGAYVVDNYVNLNQDDTVHGAAFVEMDTGTRLTFEVDGGPPSVPGEGRLELRTSSGRNAEIDVIVNGGTPIRVLVPRTDNDPGWRQTVWERVHVPDLPLIQDTMNTLEIVVVTGGLGLDEIVVSTRQDVFHSHAPFMAGLRPGELEQMVAYMLQLDGRPENAVPGLGHVDLRVTSSELTWNPVPGATSYDVVAGDLRLLRSSRDLAAALTDCLVDDGLLTTAALPGGESWQWYLVRPQSAGAVGSWDSGSVTSPRDGLLAGAAGACP